jgi:hypothetical protein
MSALREFLNSLGDYPPVLAAVPRGGWICLASALLLAAFEAMRWTGRPWRLAAVPLVALFASLTAFGPSGLAGRDFIEAWGFGFVAGLLLGALAALRTPMIVDHSFNVLRVRNRGAGILLLLAFALLFVTNAWHVRTGGPLAVLIASWGLAIAAGVVAGFFWGRAVTIWLRARRMPHTDIVGAFYVTSI